MMARQYQIQADDRFTSLPISAVIQTANRFGCDIYIKSRHGRYNVKDYGELQKGIQLQRKTLIVYFDGADEKEAVKRFRILFGA